MIDSWLFLSPWLLDLRRLKKGGLVDSYVKIAVNGINLSAILATIGMIIAVMECNKDQIILLIHLCIQQKIAIITIYGEYG